MLRPWLDTGSIWRDWAGESWRVEGSLTTCRLLNCYKTLLQSYFSPT